MKPDDFLSLAYSHYLRTTTPALLPPNDHYLTVYRVLVNLANVYIVIDYSNPRDCLRIVIVNIVYDRGWIACRCEES